MDTGKEKKTTTSNRFGTGSSLDRMQDSAELCELRVIGDKGSGKSDLCESVFQCCSKTQAKPLTYYLRGARTSRQTAQGRALQCYVREFPDAMAPKGGDLSQLVVLVCFDVSSRTSFQHAVEGYLDHVLHETPGTQAVLVGCKTDLRPAASSGSSNSSNKPVLLAEESPYISTGEGQAQAERYGVVYVEHSSKTGETSVSPGNKEVLGLAIRAKEHKEKKGVADGGVSALGSFSSDADVVFAAISGAFQRAQRLKSSGGAGHVATNGTAGRVRPVRKEVGSRPPANKKKKPGLCSSNPEGGGGCVVC